MDIFLSDRAFIDTVVASIEAYRDECLGLLLGYNTPNRIVVEDCIVYQTAERGPTGVEPNWRRETKIIGTIPELTQLQPLGYFHSHTQLGGSKGIAELSELDELSILPMEIEIVVAINNSKRTVKWHTVNDQGLAGTIGKFHVTLAAFYKRKNGEIGQYQLSCPYVLGFDYTF